MAQALMARAETLKAELDEEKHVRERQERLERERVEREGAVAELQARQGVTMRHKAACKTLADNRPCRCHHCHRPLPPTAAPASAGGHRDGAAEPRAALAQPRHPAHEECSGRHAPCRRAHGRWAAGLGR